MSKTVDTGIPEKYTKLGYVNLSPDIFAQKDNDLYLFFRDITVIEMKYCTWPIPVYRALCRSDKWFTPLKPGDDIPEYALSITRKEYISRVDLVK